jgi:cytochrome P450
MKRNHTDASAKPSSASQEVLSPATNLSEEHFSIRLPPNMEGNLLWTAGCGLVLASLLVFLGYERRSRSSKFIRVPGYPVVGNFFDIGIDVLLIRLKQFTKLYGNIFLLEVFHKKILHVSDVKLCREVLQRRPKHLKRGVNLESLAKIMGYLPYGLFHSTDPVIWSKMKKMSAPAFSKQNVQLKTKILFEEALRMVDRLKVQAEHNCEVDMLREANTLAVQVISKVAFGNEPVAYFFDSQFYDDSSIALKVILENALFVLPRWMWKLTPMYKTELLALEGNQRFERACQDVIDRKRKQHNSMTEADKRELHDLIDIMIRQEGVTDAEILANVKTFYVAGSDTTSVSVTWAMLLLHKHPAALQKLRQEVLAFFALPLQTLSAQAIAEAIGALPYTLAVLKEAIRLYPVAPLIFLDFLEQEPLVLSNGMVVDTDITIQLDVWACHLDNANFAEAERFFPERWLTEDKQALIGMEQAFMGFGGGPRACPGMTLALNEGVMAIAALAHHFDFELACPEEVRVEYKFTMQPNKMPMRMKLRTDL